MVPRWALRFWPGTRALVDDQIGLAPSNHGTESAQFVCGNGCAPAVWQQAAGSHFINALNSRQETFPGISYTQVYTRTDEVVTPNSNDNGSSSLHGGGGAITNVAIQDVCPADLTEHNGLGTADNTAYALAIDAERPQIKRQLGMLQRAGWHADRDRLALLLARQDRLLQLGVGRRRRGEPLAGNQDVVAAAPSRDIDLGADLRGLGPREVETLRWIPHGLTHAEIARRMGLTLATVNTYAKRIRGKLKVGSRSDLTRIAIELSEFTIEHRAAA